MKKSIKTRNKLPNTRVDKHPFHLQKYKSRVIKIKTSKSEGFLLCILWTLDLRDGYIGAIISAATSTLWLSLLLQICNNASFTLLEGPSFEKGHTDALDGAE